MSDGRNLRREAYIERLVEARALLDCDFVALVVEVLDEAEAAAMRAVRDGLLGDLPAGWQDPHP